ncbi:MAG: hypothetical protein IPK92_12615 [Nitrospira sp.]|nr:hypothetical protein [Nitrospira sp.]
MAGTSQDNFGWSLEEQECYRVSMPEQDSFRLRQELVKALFGLHAKTDEDLSAISDQFGDEEHLVFNRALLPAAGVGEDSFFLNEYLGEGKTLLDFDTLYEYDYDDHCFQEQARKDEAPEYVMKPYRGALYHRWARLFIDGAFHYASLCMAAGYVYSNLDEFGQKKVSMLIPHRYVNAKDHGKREGKGTIFSQRLDAGGKEAQAEELQRRFWDYLSQRFDALLTEFLMVRPARLSMEATAARTIHTRISSLVTRRPYKLCAFGSSCGTAVPRRRSCGTGCSHQSW